MELSGKEKKAIFAFSYHRSHTHTHTKGPLSRFVHMDIHDRLVLYVSLWPNKPVSCPGSHYTLNKDNILCYIFSGSFVWIT